MPKPIANLSLDLDNQWAYLRAAGREGWEQSACYFHTVIPRIVNMLQELDLPLTVFMVGRDFESTTSIAAMRGFADLKAWEPGNHSYNHEPWLHTLPREAIEAEIDRTAANIDQHLGTAPVGFRGPGFSCPETVLSVLAERGYAYDASVFPTSMAPVARAYYMMKTGLKGADRDRASQLYGGWSAVRQPNRPFPRMVDGRQLWELPVTVLPLARTPIHFSYFTYLASFSRVAAKAYFRTAMRLCRLTNCPPALLLHPPDFMGREDDCEMAFFPSMKMPREKKLDIVRWALQRFASAFDVRTMRAQVAALSSTPLPSSVRPIVSQTRAADLAPPTIASTKS